MKLKKYCVYVALLPAMLFGFASCSDNDDEPVAVVEKTPLQLGENVSKLKIGAENRTRVSIADGTEYFDAFSLNPEILEVTMDTNGDLFLEGKANGNTSVVVTDGNNELKRFPVMVYTTEQLKLSHSTYDLTIRFGDTAEVEGEVKVLEGNGEYTISCDNSYVDASIDAETGEITFEAAPGLEEYAAVVTVSDVSNLSSTFTVNVTPNLDPYTEDELNDILAIDENMINQNGGTFYYFRQAPESMTTWTENGMTTTGWLWTTESWWGEETYKFLFAYPEGTQVGQEVDGQLIKVEWQETVSEGKVKILQDDATRFVAIYWRIDTDRLSIDRAYLVWIK